VRRARARVLFLCIGNSCRSQMAEGFARAYGPDVMEPSSAGLYPASIVSPLTKKVMLEKNIDISKHFPKGLEGLPPGDVDVLINISGQTAPAPKGGVVEEWKIRDPIGLSEEVFREVANEVEQHVMRLVLSLRNRSRDSRATSVRRPLRSGHRN
jgi:arsenate reductase (thioredoxin)